MSFGDEQRLLSDLRNGDVKAFQSIYTIYAPRLTRKLIQLLRSEELAEDVLQDIFVKIWEIRETIDPEQNFGALLFKMAGNLSKNIFRKRLYDEVMRRQVGQDDGYDHIDYTINQYEAKSLLEKALDQLTPRQREVYTLQKIDGYSYREISDRLHISASAINHHIQEAGRKVRSILKSHYFLVLITSLLIISKK